MISGELDILKDWCYEAVSTSFFLFFLVRPRKNHSLEICLGRMVREGHDRVWCPDCEGTPGAGAGQRGATNSPGCV